MLFFGGDYYFFFISLMTVDWPPIILVFKKKIKGPLIINERIKRYRIAPINRPPPPLPQLPQPSTTSTKSLIWSAANVRSSSSQCRPIRKWQIWPFTKAPPAHSVSSRVSQSVRPSVRSSVALLVSYAFFIYHFGFQRFFLLGCGT